MTTIMMGKNKVPSYANKTPFQSKRFIPSTETQTTNVYSPLSHTISCRDEDRNVFCIYRVFPPDHLKRCIYTRKRIAACHKYIAKLVLI
jgi:hypothetical protein